MQYNCWSLRCSWSIANYIFLLNLTCGFNGLGKDNCKTRRETFMFGDWVRLILENWRFTPFYLHLHYCMHGLSQWDTTPYMYHVLERRCYIFSHWLRPFSSLLLAKHIKRIQFYWVISTDLPQSYFQQVWMCARLPNRYSSLMIPENIHTFHTLVLWVK